MIPRLFVTTSSVTVIQRANATQTRRVIGATANSWSFELSVGIRIAISLPLGHALSHLKFVGKSIEAMGVQGVLILPKSLATFVDHALEIKLWEDDPFLADAGAKLVDEFVFKRLDVNEDKLETS